LVCPKRSKENASGSREEAERLGLYDMHGNVWECCQDLYSDYPPDASTDPQDPNGSTPRLDRGGAYYSDAAHCRAAYRDTSDPMIRSRDRGFRVSRSPSVTQPEAERNNKKK
jgi:formylglycine-generating enzyme required for sulfatase activity